MMSRERAWREGTWNLAFDFFGSICQALAAIRFMHVPPMTFLASSRGASDDVQSFVLRALLATVL